MFTQITIKDIESIRVAYKTYKGKVLSAGKLMPSIFKSIKGKNNSHPFFCIHSLDKETGIGIIDLCVPTMETPNIKDVFVKELSYIKAISLLHKGSYERLSSSYQLLHTYSIKKHLQIVVPFLEMNIKGPGALIKGNPNTYITEIQYPMVFPQVE